MDWTSWIVCFVQAIQHPLFDAFFAGVVFVNAIFTGLEAPSWSWRVKCQGYISWPFCHGPRFWQIHVGMFGVRCPSPPWEPTKRQSAAPEVESSIAQQHSRQLLSDWQIRLSHYIFFTLFLRRICDVCDGRNWMELTWIDIFVWNITSHWALPHVCRHLLTFFALWFHIFVDAVPRDLAIRGKVFWRWFHGHLPRGDEDMVKNAMDLFWDPRNPFQCWSGWHQLEKKNIYIYI